MMVGEAVATAACGLALKTAFAASRFASAALSSTRLGRSAVFRRRSPDDQQFSNMLDRRGLQLFANGRQEGFALFPKIVVDANLDEFVAVEAVRDFAHNGFAEAVLADRDNGVEPMGSGAQGAAFFGCDVEHAGNLCKTRILPGLSQ